MKECCGMTDEQLLISEESNTMRTLGNVSLFPQRENAHVGVGGDDKNVPNVWLNTFLTMHP